MVHRSDFWTMLASILTDLCFFMGSSFSISLIIFYFLSCLPISALFVLFCILVPFTKSNSCWKSIGELFGFDRFKIFYSIGVFFEFVLADRILVASESLHLLLLSKLDLSCFPTLDYLILESFSEITSSSDCLRGLTYCF